MGSNEGDKLTETVNLQSFSSPYSPQFVINKSEFKGKSIKQLMKEHLDSENNYNINNNDINLIPKNSTLNYSLFMKNRKEKLVDISIPSVSTEDEEIKKEENKKFRVNPVSISTKKEISEKEKLGKKIISKIIIEDDTNQTKTTIFTTTSSLQKDINNIYNFKEVIGKGAFGIVRTGYRKKEFSPHKIYAIKSIYKKQLNKRDINNLEKEIDILSSLDHPNISRFYEAFHDENYFNIVMELCRGKLLTNFLKSNGGFLD